MLSTEITHLLKKIKIGKLCYQMELVLLVIGLLTRHQYMNLKMIQLPKEVDSTIDNLLYNSIHIVMIAAKDDTIGDNFALYIPQEDVIFHRLSKLNFLGENYAGKNGETILMAEKITFRPKVL